MTIEITMPRLSDTMESGTVLKWNVKPGDAVSAGDTLADIETDKATMELQSFDDGTVARILIGEGEAVDIGKPIMLLAEEDERVEDVANEAVGASSPAASATQATVTKQAKNASADESQAATAIASSPAAAPPQPTTGAEASHLAGRVFASPLARKIADENGVDLATIQGTGPSNRITKRDVEAVVHAGAEAKSAPTAEPATLTPAELRATPSAALATPIPGPTLEHRVIELSNMRRAIARVLVESKQSIPHYQVTVAARMDALLSLRTQLNEQLAAQGVKLSVNDFLVRACALAMFENPFVNSRWVESAGVESIEIMPEINIGVAIALPVEKGGGLVVATLRNADRLGLRLVSQRTKELANKARTRGLTIEEMADSTFTISNLGMFGVEHFTAIINPPNACILAVGAAVEKPIVRDGAVVIGHEMAMTLSSDHRIVDGAMAAHYLGSVKAMLENPATLLV